MLMATMFGLYLFLLKLYADGRYHGANSQAAMKTIMAQVNVEIVKRSDQAKGFTVGSAGSSPRNGSGGD
jgi:hypothetical protein